MALSWVQGVYPRERAQEAVQSTRKFKQLSAVCRDWMSLKAMMSPDLDKMPVFAEHMFSPALCLTSCMVWGKSLKFSESPVPYLYTRTHPNNLIKGRGGRRAATDSVHRNSEMKQRSFLTVSCSQSSKDNRHLNRYQCKTVIIMALQ